MTAVSERRDERPGERAGSGNGRRRASPRGTAKPPAAKGRRSLPANQNLRVRLFDADRKDRVLSLDDALATKLTARQLLWIDILDEPSAEESEQLAKAFGLDRRTRAALESPGDRPHLALHGSYLHVRVAAEPNDRHPDQTGWLDIVGARNVVITHHRTPIGYLDDMDERIELDTSFGLLDSATFVASVLDGAVTSYFRTVDAIEEEVDKLDAKSLRNDGGYELLDDLVALRRRIARLRRLLTDHRELFASLAGADVAQVTENPDGGPAFQAVANRFDSAIAAVEDSREVLLGSFDVYMTRTAQRTNDVMKVLALATVLLLPGSLVAGLLGMNVPVPLSKDDPASFWFVVGGVVVFALFILGVARRRRWL